MLADYHPKTMWLILLLSTMAVPNVSWALEVSAVVPKQPEQIVAKKYFFNDGDDKVNLVYVLSDNGFAMTGATDQFDAERAWQTSLFFEKQRNSYLKDLDRLAARKAWFTYHAERVRANKLNQQVRDRQKREAGESSLGLLLGDLRNSLRRQQELLSRMVPRRTPLNANGEIDFDADGDFHALNDGDADSLALSYSQAISEALKARSIEGDTFGWAELTRGRTVEDTGSGNLNVGEGDYVHIQLFGSDFQKNGNPTPVISEEWFAQPGLPGDERFRKLSVGDQNGDGIWNSVLDAELAFGLWNATPSPTGSIFEVPPLTRVPKEARPSGRLSMRTLLYFSFGALSTASVDGWEWSKGNLPFALDGRQQAQSDVQAVNHRVFGNDLRRTWRQTYNVRTRGHVIPPQAKKPNPEQVHIVASPALQEMVSHEHRIGLTRALAAVDTWQRLSLEQRKVIWQTGRRHSSGQALVEGLMDAALWIQREQQLIEEFLADVTVLHAMISGGPKFLQRQYEGAHNAKVRDYGQRYATLKALTLEKSWPFLGYAAKNNGTVSLIMKEPRTGVFPLTITVQRRNGRVIHKQKVDVSVVALGGNDKGTKITNETSPSLPTAAN